MSEVTAANKFGAHSRSLSYDDPSSTGTFDLPRFFVCSWRKCQHIHVIFHLVFFRACFRHIDVGVHKSGAHHLLIPPAEPSVCVVLSVSIYEKSKNKGGVCAMGVVRGQDASKRDPSRALGFIHLITTWKILSHLVFRTAIQYITVYCYCNKKCLAIYLKE